MKSKLASIFNGFKGVGQNPTYDYDPIKNPVVEEVEEYYNSQTAKYLATYGRIIQAARPTSDTEFIKHISDNIGIEDGMHLLDAGCGVCGPAVEFAKLKKITIDAVTISEVQVLESKKHIAENNLDLSINVKKGDFTNLELIYPHNSFDKIYFLETLGYSSDFKKVLEGAIKVLKIGGSIYIKDFFTVPILDREHKITQHKIIQKIRVEYLYKVFDITELIAVSRDLGLYIEFIKPFSLKEDFTRAASFELQDDSHGIYTTAITTPFQLFEVLEVKFRKV
jgi:ubiquinone/menaquinone biosynthesis C-methylase UbiE